MGAGFAGAADAGDSGGTDHLMALYAIFVTWRMMGKNYDAGCWLRVIVVLASVQRQRQSPHAGDH